MKSSVPLAVFVLLLSVDVLFASPLINRVPDKALQLSLKKSVKWERIPDVNGNMYLVDMNSYNFSSVPAFVAEKEVKFLLTTKHSKGQELKLDEASIGNSSFNRDHPTRFTIHGWNGDHTSDVNALVTEEYLKHGDFNCIMVDWSRGSGTLDYIAARYRIDDVAKFTAKFIDFLHFHGYLHFEELHIVGHSLGGHAAGLVGKHVSRGRVQAIFGLDPAGPLFSIDKPLQRIASDDGVYVEIIHTNGATLGFGKPLGQADFYPNYGRSQPGCGVDITGSCAHGRAPTFFAESLQANNGFVANRCADFNEVNNGRCTVQSDGHRMGGEPPNSGLSGIFYLTTNSAAPFARG